MRLTCNNNLGCSEYTTLRRDSYMYPQNHVTNALQNITRDYRYVTISIPQPLFFLKPTHCSDLYFFPTIFVIPKQTYMVNIHFGEKEHFIYRTYTRILTYQTKIHRLWGQPKVLVNNYAPCTFSGVVLKIALWFVLSNTVHIILKSRFLENSFSK